MKRFFNIILLSLNLLWAATYVPDILDKTSGLEHIGAGYAGVARPFTLSAPYWNPAGLYLVDKNSIGVNYYTRMEEVTHTSIDGFYNYSPNLKLGFNFAQEQISDIPKTYDVGGEGVKIGSFSDSYRVYNLAGAMKLQPGTYAGFNFKLLTRDISDYSASGYGFDLGLINVIDENNSFGLNLKNLISGITWSTRLEELLERKIAVGYSYKTKLVERDFFIDMDYEFYTADTFKNTWFLGCEHWFVPKEFAWRAGFNGYRQFTLGLGFYYHDFKTDLAYVIPEENFKNMLLFSLGFDFQLRPRSEVQEIEEPGAPGESGVALTDGGFMEKYEIQEEKVLVTLINYQDLVKIAVIDPNKDVVYFAPEEFNSGVFSFKLIKTGTYTVFYQQKDGKIFKQRISL